MDTNQLISALAVMVAILSILIAIRTHGKTTELEKAALRLEYMIKSASAHTELSQQANLINEAWLSTKLPTPYMVLLDIQDAEFSPLSVLFFHHINLLSIAYRNRHFIGKEAERNYLRFFKKTFRPWIESDERLVQLWYETIKTRDWFGQEFFDWLKPVANGIIYKPKSSGNTKVQTITQ